MADFALFLIKRLWKMERTRLPERARAERGQRTV
jgi:hypothetical protein